jgi:hypothetical protein
MLLRMIRCTIHENEKCTVNQLFKPLSDAALRQLVDSTSIFQAWREAARQARAFEGGMYFKREGVYEYLVRTTRDNRQIRLGRRTEEMERTYSEFIAMKRKTEERERSLSNALGEAQRLNKALRVGRAPDVLVSVLNRLDQADILEAKVVVGSAALFGYETEAGVHFVKHLPAEVKGPHGADTDMHLLLASLLASGSADDVAVLEEPAEALKQIASEVGIRPPGGGFQVAEISIWKFPSQSALRKAEWAFRAEDAKPSSWKGISIPVVVSRTGRMAAMPVIAPERFVQARKWMATGIAGRIAERRVRDALEADAVGQLLRERMLLE